MVCPAGACYAYTGPLVVNSEGRNGHLSFWTLIKEHRARSGLLQSILGKKEKLPASFAGIKLFPHPLLHKFPESTGASITASSVQATSCLRVYDI